jgi:hypothetical protein
VVDAAGKMSFALLPPSPGEAAGALVVDQPVADDGPKSLLA